MVIRCGWSPLTNRDLAWRAGYDDEYPARRGNLDRVSVSPLSGVTAAVG
jgi:hypothetical protein